MSLLAAGALAGRKILLGITGSIAAYKAPFIYRQLNEAGAEVRVVMTKSASEFIGSAVFRGLGAQVFTDMWEGSGEAHMNLSSWADALLIAPATADTLARLRQGRADDLLSATALCSDKMLLIAPAMHPTMWSHPATQENASVLKERGAIFLGPAKGVVASGDTGIGRMEEPDGIASAVTRLLESKLNPLDGRHLVITAGPTREPLDPVRSLTNLSTGKMGYSLAAVALDQGARVTLISGPVTLPAPTGVQLVEVESAQEMQQALDVALGRELDAADALIMSAAVSDYRPKTTAEAKLKRGESDLVIELSPNPDILAEIGKRRAALRPVLVGFALETAEGDELILAGRQKLIKKQVDMVVANSAHQALGTDDNVVRLVSALDCISLPRMSKSNVAARIIDWVRARLEEPEHTDTTH